MPANLTAVRRPLCRLDRGHGTNVGIRVSRLNQAGTAWEQVVGGPSPINHANDQEAPNRA